MKLTLSIPGFEKLDSDLPTGVPTGGLDTTGLKAIWVAIELFILGAILLFLYYVIRGGINMITSGGDKEKFQRGRERVRYAIIGLVVIFFSLFMVNFIAGFFGVNLLSLYAPTSIQKEQKPKSIDEQLMKICTDRWEQSYCTCLLHAKSTLTVNQQTQVSNTIIAVNQIPQQIIDLAKSQCGDAR